MKQPISLFLTGFVQVYFVSVNTYFIASNQYAGVLVAAFCISMIWSYNVRKVVFGTMADRFTYAIGAALGSVTGLFCSAGLVRIIESINI